MNQCVYCGEVFRGVRHRCPDCGKRDMASAIYHLRFDRIQLALQLSDLRMEDAAKYQAKALQLLQQNMCLAEIVEWLEANHNGQTGHFTKILKNLSGVNMVH